MGVGSAVRLSGVDASGAVWFFLLTMVDLVRNKGLFDNFLGVFAIFFP